MLMSSVCWHTTNGWVSLISAEQYGCNTHASDAFKQMQWWWNPFSRVMQKIQESNWLKSLVPGSLLSNTVASTGPEAELEEGMFGFGHCFCCWAVLVKAVWVSLWVASTVKQTACSSVGKAKFVCTRRDEGQLLPSQAGEELGMK